MLDKVPLVPIDEALDWEARTLETIAACPETAVYRLWRSQRCLVMPSHLARAPEFYAAAKSLEADGWRLHYRRTGGGATPQGPGVMNVSLLYSAPKDTSIEASYDTLCQPIELSLNDFGVHSTRGPLSGAFCDGRFNILIDGRKIAGTAQRRTMCPKHPGRSAILLHALLLLERLPAATYDALNRLRSGNASTFCILPEKHTSLRNYVTVQPFLSVLTARYSKHFELK